MKLILTYTWLYLILSINDPVGAEGIGMPEIPKAVNGIDGEKHETYL